MHSGGCHAGGIASISVRSCFQEPMLAFELVTSMLNIQPVLQYTDPVRSLRPIPQPPSSFCPSMLAQLCHQGEEQHTQRPLDDYHPFKAAPRNKDHLG